MQNGVKIEFWRGTRGAFKDLLRNGSTKPNRVYFVGNDDFSVDGFGVSTFGAVYVTAEDGAVIRFGSFSSNEDADVVAARLEGLIKSLQDGKADKDALAAVAWSGLWTDVVGRPEPLTAQEVEEICTP